MLRRGDLLLEKSGGGENQPVGTVVQYDHDAAAVCSNFIARMPVASGFDSRFLTYVHAALYAQRITTRSIKQSTGIQNLDSDSYLREIAPFPDREEQRAIAAFLDRETTKIDALIAKKERLVELLQEKRGALVAHAVSRGLDQNVSMKASGISWLGRIPVHWDIKPLGTILRRITYGFTNPMPVADEGPYLLTAFDVGDGEILFHQARHTFEEAFTRLITDKSRPKPGDILLTKDGTLGRVAVAGDERMCINQSVALLRLDQSLANADFVQNLLRSDMYQFQMVANAGGTAIKHIYITRLAKMPVPVPPVEEQRRIASFIATKRSGQDALIATVGKAVERLTELRSTLIAAAVTGQIDVREEVS